MKKINTIVDRTLNLDPELTRLREKEDDEEAMLIMSCPHCSAALRARWNRDAYKDLVKRHTKSSLHSQAEAAIRRRENRK